MRNNKRIAVAAAAGSLLVAGMVTALTLTSGTARADEITQCEVFPNAGGQCNLSTTVTGPPAFGGLQLQIASKPSSYHANVTWSDDCTSASGQTVAESGTGGGTAPEIVTLTVGVSNPVSCEVTANVQMDINKTFVNGFMYLDTEPASSNPTPTPTATSSAPTGGPVGVIKGYDNKCVDDAGNSSSIRGKVILWTCSSSDKAQKWEYAAGELVHNGLCLDDQGNGGSGSKIILWTCNESPGEQWNHVLNNTFQVKAHNFTLCLDDPAYSKKNGVQLAIYACHNTSNQHWTVP